MEDTPQSPDATRPDPTARWLRLVLYVLLAVIGGYAAWLGWVYFSTPPAIRQPKQAHFHLRIQIINGGQPVDFAADKFQTDFNKDVCTANITKEPFHFHDHLGQFAHVHWQGMTGGLLLKDYGWNFIGGSNSTLGYEFTKPLQPVRLFVHGAALPAAPAGAHYYVYTGNADSHAERSWNDFLKNDLKAFFAAKPVSWLDRFVPAAAAHADDPELLKLNDVVGNVVIFAQATKPTDAQVKDRFNNLIDLPESACGG